MLACLKAHSGGSTAGMVTCLDEERARWQKRLDAAFQASLKAYAADDKAYPRDAKGYVGTVEPLTASRVGLLREAQSAWEHFRMADCKVEMLRTDGGTASSIALASCTLDRTIERALSIESRLAAYHR